MAINASTNWYVRVSGNVLNGGGFDSAISGSGTNFADQDSPQLSLSDLATPSAGSTTLTSAAGGFTTAMIGNCIRIASGTNFTAGYYFITARTDTNTVTIDRTASPSGAGASGVGRVGGAFANFNSVSTTATIASPMIAGNTVNVRGSGSQNPVSADYSYTGLLQFPSGSLSGNGLINFVGYNGRPKIACNSLLLHQITGFYLENLHFFFSGGLQQGNGIITGGAQTFLYDCWFDQAGFDDLGVACASARFCRFFNSGSSAVGTSAMTALTLSGAPPFGAVTEFNEFDNWRGSAVASGASAPIIQYNVIRNCKHNGIVVSHGDIQRNTLIQNNSFYGNLGNGVLLNSANDIAVTSIKENIFEANGLFGINCSSGTVTQNNARVYDKMSRNFFFSNGSGNQNGKSAGILDVTLTASPFVNAPSGNFNLNTSSGAGALVRSGASTNLPNNLGTSYLDGGAIQSIASGGGGGLILPRPMNGGYSA